MSLLWGGKRVLPVWASVFALVSSPLAAQWTFSIFSTCTGGAGCWLYVRDSTNMIPIDTNAKGAIVVIPEGSDSIFWSWPNKGIKGKTCRTCSYLETWLQVALIQDAGIGPPTDSQEVVLSGKSYLYLHRSNHSGTAGAPGSGSTAKRFLRGIGTLSYDDSFTGGTTYWYNQVILLDYNGMNVDSLVKEALKAPTSITRRAPSKYLIRGRNFNLTEMGVFLGRIPNSSSPFPPYK